MPPWRINLAMAFWSPGAFNGSPGIQSPHEGRAERLSRTDEHDPTGPGSRLAPHERYAAAMAGVGVGIILDPDEVIDLEICDPALPMKEDPGSVIRGNNVLTTDEIRVSSFAVELLPRPLTGSPPPPSPCPDGHEISLAHPFFETTGEENSSATDRILLTLV